MSRSQRLLKNARPLSNSLWNGRPKQSESTTTRRPAIRLQAWGESLDPFRLDRVYALDERLTRQFEKTLAMLIRLREMRVAGQAAA